MAEDEEENEHKMDRNSRYILARDLNSGLPFSCLLVSITALSSLPKRVNYVVGERCGAKVTFEMGVMTATPVVLRGDDNDRRCADKEIRTILFLTKGKDILEMVLGTEFCFRGIVCRR